MLCRPKFRQLLFTQAGNSGDLTVNIFFHLINPCNKILAVISKFADSIVTSNDLKLYLNIMVVNLKVRRMKGRIFNYLSFEICSLRRRITLHLNIYWNYTPCLLTIPFQFHTYFTHIFTVWSRDSIVSMMIRLKDEQWGVQIPAEATDVSLYHNIQTDFGAHTASYLVGTVDSLTRGKEAWAWGWALTSVLCRG
jgi:hypothetical protein